MIVHVLVTFYNDIHMQITNIIWPPGSLPPAVPLVKQKIKFVWPYIVSMKQLGRVAKGYEILIFDLTKLRTEFEQLYYEQQNILLNGLLCHHETKKTSGHISVK